MYTCDQVICYYNIVFDLFNLYFYLYWFNSCLFIPYQISTILGSAIPILDAMVSTFIYFIMIKRWPGLSLWSSLTPIIASLTFSLSPPSIFCHAMLCYSLFLLPQHNKTQHNTQNTQNMTALEPYAYPYTTLSEYGSVSGGDHNIMAEIYARGPVSAYINAVRWCGDMMTWCHYALHHWLPPMLHAIILPSSHMHSVFCILYFVYSVLSTFPPSPNIPSYSLSQYCLEDPVYTEGIIMYDTCSNSTTNHAIQLNGWGTEVSAIWSKSEFWVLRWEEETEGGRKCNANILILPVYAVLLRHYAIKSLA